MRYLLSTTRHFQKVTHHLPRVLIWLAILGGTSSCVARVNKAALVEIKTVAVVSFVSIVEETNADHLFKPYNKAQKNLFSQLLEDMMEFSEDEIARLGDWKVLSSERLIQRKVYQSYAKALKSKTPEDLVAISPFWGQMVWVPQNGLGTKANQAVVLAENVRLAERLGVSGLAFIELLPQFKWSQGRDSRAKVRLRLKARIRVISKKGQEAVWVESPQVEEREWLQTVNRMAGAPLFVSRFKVEKIYINLIKQALTLAVDKARRRL